MSRVEDAKRRLREAADAAEPEKHLPALVRSTPATMLLVGLALGVAIAATPPLRRRALGLFLKSRNPYR